MLESQRLRQHYADVLKPLIFEVLESTDNELYDAIHTLTRYAGRQVEKARSRERGFALPSDALPGILCPECA